MAPGVRWGMRKIRKLLQAGPWRPEQVYEQKKIFWIICSHFVGLNWVFMSSCFYGVTFFPSRLSPTYCFCQQEALWCSPTFQTVILDAGATYVGMAKAQSIMRLHYTIAVAECNAENRPLRAIYMATMAWLRGQVPLGSWVLRNAAGRRRPFLTGKVDVSSY